MINKKHIIDKIKKNFPSWSDIRRKTENSNGGQVLVSLSEEVEEINKAIEEYKKEFFIESYTDKYDELIDYLHKAVIGDVSGLDFELIIPNLEITKDSMEFKKEDLAYYDGENIVLKGKHVPSSKEITYSINGAIITSNLEQFHVWNQFDEFALFMGLRRLENESNKSLLRRIELEAKRPPNSTRNGLKNAIANLIESKEEDIDLDEIKVSGVGPANLNQEIDGEKVIDHLMKINKDVFKEKTWDLDIWNYQFDSTTYLPIKWDEDVVNYQDGVGFHNDLMANRSRTDGVGNVEVTMLNKSVEKVKKYIRDINLRDEISIPIHKYSNEISPIDAIFRVEAKNIKDITASEIKIIGHSIKSSNREELLDPIMINKNDLELIDDNSLEDGDLLRLEFKHDKIDTMDIYSLYTYEDDVKKDLFDKTKLPFPFVYEEESNSIKNSKIKFLATSKDDLYLKENIKDLDIGFAQDKKEESAKLSIDVGGMKNEIFKVDYKANLSSVSHALINSNNFERIGSNSYKGETTSELAFSISANKLSLHSDELIEITINNKTFTSSGTFETEETLKSSTIDVHIKNISNKEITISDILYSSFDIDVDLEEGELISFMGDYMLPNIDNNILSVEFKTNNSEDLIIEKIRIGYDTAGDSFSLNIDWKDTYKGIYIDSNCTNKKYINGILVDDNYKTSIGYRPLNQDSLIELDISKFISVDSITVDAGTVTSNRKNGITTNYIYLTSEEVLTTIRIKGAVRSKEEVIDLNNYFNILPSRGDKLFCCHNEKFIISQKNGKEEKLHISDSIFKRKHNFYDFITTDNKIESVFSRSISGDNLLISKKCDSFFKHLYIWTKEKRTYIANNSLRCFSKIQEDIEIVNNFRPMISSNELMFYRLYDMTKEENLYQTKFNNGNKFSIGRKKITITTNIDFTDSSAFQLEDTFLNKSFVLSDYAFIDRYEKIIKDGEEVLVDIAEYILTPKDGYEVIYSKKSPTSNYDEAVEYFQIEKIIPQEDGFNKLKYSNIDELIYIGLSDWDGTYNKQDEISQNHYSLLKDKGIIVWDEDTISSDLEIILVYTIKIPTRIRIPLDILYKSTDIPVDAYDIVARRSFDVKVSDTHQIPYNSITTKDFTDVRLRIDNNNIGYSLGKEHVELINNNKEESIVINSGYYYIGDKEYYMYISPKVEEINRLENIETNNVTYLRDSIITNKSSVNYLKNPSFKLDKLTSVFKKEYNKQDLGISHLGRISSCDCYNMWTIENGEMNLVKGLNGIGLEFIPNLQDGYAYLRLPNSESQVHISFFSSSTIKAWIGKLSESNIIEKESALERESSFYSGKYEGENNYLIVTGAGVIDDILLRDKAIGSDNHIKNIDKLRILVDEYEDFPKTKTISFGRNFNLDRLEMNHENVIRTGSSIEWGDSLLRAYNKNEDWRNTFNENVEIVNGSIITKSERGFFKTRPIKINNRESLKELKLNINKVYLETLKGFTVEVFTGSRIDSVNKKCFEGISNFAQIDASLLDDFISIRVNMPPLKTVTDLEIFSVYRETSSQLKPTEYNSGTGLSKVFDVDITSDIKLSSFNLKELSKIDDISIRTRAAKGSNKGNYVWTDWNDVTLNNKGEVLNEIIFKEHKLLQVEVHLKNKSAQVKLESMTVEIHEGGSF